MMKDIKNLRNFDLILPLGGGKPGIKEWMLFAGVFCGLIYFFFSKEHKGAFGTASRIEICILMITFGAGFSNTVMARISLLVGRMQFIFTDWLG